MSDTIPVPGVSGVRITDVRVSNFRSLHSIEVRLDDLTVLVGANNAGKTSFLDALYAAIGSGRRTLGQDDIRLAPSEALPPKDRVVTIDVKARPVGDDGVILDAFPIGSFWTQLWGTGIALDSSDSHEFMAFRTTLSWSVVQGDYVLKRNFLKEWSPTKEWLASAVLDQRVSTTQLEPIGLHYIDAKRDIDDDLRKQGSFWRRLTDDLGLPELDIQTFEDALTNLNQLIVDKSKVLLHLKNHLGAMQSVVTADGAAIDISPVARRLRDLSKGIDVSFSTTGGQSFPLARHGMGTRSLASLLVFRAFASWRSSRATKEGDVIHSMLALEEPEAHLHPQSQRSLFTQIEAIPGQRIVSTHSPYFAGRARLKNLRLFSKRGGDTIVTQLDLTELEFDDVRKLEQTVVESRGDLLFACGAVLFEGQTEEQAMPIWAHEYWGASIHALGFSFVRVNGNEYFPFIWLAEQLGIPWYVLGDSEVNALAALTAALARAGRGDLASCDNVVHYPTGRNFESQLIAEGYLPEIEQALDSYHGMPDYLSTYIARNHGEKKKKGGIRDYSGADGRAAAALDALDRHKARIARTLAETISNHADVKRRVPAKVAELFDVISNAHGLTRKGGPT